MLNRYTIGAFNRLYYKVSGFRSKPEGKQRIHYNKFFFPLDNIRNWNRLYGRKGFVQYQFVVPTQSGHEAVKSVLEEISKFGKGSFLSVLKKFGSANDNYLSFPMEGYTLALDFKYEENLLPLLSRLDDMVVDFGGRIYLAKDSRMSESTFKKSYPKWQQFSQLRSKLGATKRFNSMQSQRLGL